MSTVFADRIRRAKDLNRRSGAILREARKGPITVVTEGAEPVVMQRRDIAARDALTRSWLLRLEPLIEHLQGRARAITREFSWVGDLQRLNRRRFADELVGRFGTAARRGDFEAFEQWLYEWEVASEVDREMARRPVERPDPLPLGQPPPTFELVFANSKAEKSWVVAASPDASKSSAGASTRSARSSACGSSSRATP